MFRHIGTIVQELTAPREEPTLLDELKSIAHDNGYDTVEVAMDNGLSAADLALAHQAGIPIPALVSIS